MTTYSAKIIADSENVFLGTRLTTMEVTFPRFILPEMTRHRKFSFSVESSRARSLTKTIELVNSDPFVPDYWGKHQKGMAAHQEVSDSEAIAAGSVWLSAKQSAVRSAQAMEAIGLHKQLVNRILEPFMWTTAIISSTEWDNFFNLRVHPEAQPEIQRTAQEMKFAFQHSVPSSCYRGDWHLPYVTDEEKENIDIGTLKQVSVARCARVSYLTQSEDGDISKDKILYRKLITSKHWSPAEHVATPSYQHSQSNSFSNFDNWTQLRKLVE